MAVNPPPEEPLEDPLATAELMKASRPRTIISAGIVLGAILYVVATLVGRSYGAAFFAIPFFIGLFMGLASSSHAYSNATWAFAGVVLLSVLLLREGVICLLFAMPIFLPGLYAGAGCGVQLRRYAKTREQRRRAGMTILLFGLGAQGVDALLDDPAHHPEHTARAEIALASSPERVFQSLTAESLRVSGRWQWFLRVGLPMPSELRVTRPGKDGEVRLSFNHGRAFARITDFRPGHGFAFQVTRYEIDDPPFHITRLGRGPHYGLRTERVEDWLTLEEVRYELAATPGGGTRLTRQVSWRRHLAPGFYFGWLQQSVMERGQRRLLEFIRTNVDGPAPDAKGQLEPLAAR